MGVAAELRRLYTCESDNPHFHFSSYEIKPGEIEFSRT
jgi:hypothetical protein